MRRHYGGKFDSRLLPKKISGIDQNRNLFATFFRTLLKIKIISRHLYLCKTQRCAATVFTILTKNTQRKNKISKAPKLDFGASFVGVGNLLVRFGSLLVFFWRPLAPFGLSFRILGFTFGDPGVRFPYILSSWRHSSYFLYFLTNVYKSCCCCCLFFSKLLVN